MKTGILLLLLVTTISASGQSLKDALFSGKLKTDSGTVIRKGEDLSSKIDTSTKKLKAPEKKKITTVGTDSSSVGSSAVASDSTLVDMATLTVDTSATVAVAPKDNNRLWKDCIDQLKIDLQKEVLTSKKIKEGVYSALIEYEIGIDGQITINSVSCSPDNSFLAQQIKERLTLTAPQMTPLLGTGGKPRVALKKQMLTLTK